MPLIEIGTSGAPKPGEDCSGDMYLVESFDGGVLVALIDGLGHGPEAAQAAAMVALELRKRPSRPAMMLLEDCSETMRHSRRGAVLSVATFNLAESAMTWLGIGNVAGVLLRARAPRERKRETLLLRSGFLGESLPTLLAVKLPIGSGDTLIFATDGVDPSFAEDPHVEGQPQNLADRILRRYNKRNDDALVLVARYVEDPR